MRVKDTCLPRKKNYFISDLFIAITFTIFLISAGILLAIYFRPLYYLDINILNIDEASGLSKQEIKQNYNVLIDYCSPFYKGELRFPTLASSKEGLSHFADVKVIFNIFHITTLVSFIICVAGFFYKKYHDYYKHLLIASLTAVILPMIIGIACLINFNQAFTLMHKIFFRNDDWLFDPNADQVIMILPEEYFMHCAFLIIFIVLIGSLITLLIYHMIKKKNKADTLLPMKKNYYY